VSIENVWNSFAGCLNLRWQIGKFFGVLLSRTVAAANPWLLKLRISALRLDPD
jgi:hypothetical protein